MPPTEAGREALLNGLQCLVCYDGKGNGYCSDHALDALRDVMDNPQS